MRKNKGFTLIELMIVIAIIAIIAAIAIPNLIQSRIRANEASAISVVKQIAAAQVQFQVARQGRYTSNTKAARNGYCDFYRNLYYGNPHGAVGTANLSLISKAVADAYVAGGAPSNAATIVTAPTPDGTLSAYQGYHFVEPSVQDNTPWATSFAIVAVPNNSARTGTNAYYLGEDGTVYQRGLATNETAAANYATMRTTQNLLETNIAGMTHAAFVGAGWDAL